MPRCDEQGDKMNLPNTSKYFRTWLCTAVLALATPVALANDTAEASKTGTRPTAISTGLISLRSGKAVRISLVELDEKRLPRAARLSVIDDGRRVLRKVEGMVEPTKALFLELPHREIPAAIPLIPVRFRLDIECEADEAGPVMSVELYDEAKGTIESTSSCGNPCCKNCDPSEHPWVIPMCIPVADTITL